MVGFECPTRAENFLFQDSTTFFVRFMLNIAEIKVYDTPAKIPSPGLNRCPMAIFFRVGVRALFYPGRGVVITLMTPIITITDWDNEQSKRSNNPKNFKFYDKLKVPTNPGHPRRICQCSIENSLLNEYINLIEQLLWGNQKI